MVNPSGWIAAAMLVAGCGPRGASALAGDPCMELARHVVAIVEAAGPPARRPMPPLLGELWSSVYVEACREDHWSTETHACFRRATTVQMGDACEAAEPARAGLRRRVREAREFFPVGDDARGTREEVQARSVVPIWGHPPAAGDTFAACDDYLAQLRRLATCARYQDPHLADRIAVLETERRRFGERSPRIRQMWSGYCVAEAARRRELVSARGACAAPSPTATPGPAR